MIIFPWQELDAALLKSMLDQRLLPVILVIHEQPNHWPPRLKKD